MNGKLSALMMAAFVVVACEQEGPFERAGEEIDDATDEIRNDESLRDRAEDAADELRDGVEDAADELQN